MGRPWLAQYGDVVVNGYTGDGLRAEKQVDNFGFSPTYFLYDGDQPVCELNSSGAVTAVDTFGPNGLLARGVGSTGSTGWFYSWDLSGNLAQQVDMGGAGVLDSAAVDAYGAAATTDDTPDPFSGFGGQWGGYTDAAGAGQSGLTLCTHRFYDTTTGRFLTRDPIRYEGGVNLYGYTQSNPVNKSDSTGLATWLCYRPLLAGGWPGCTAPQLSHWFLRTDCGSYGYGQFGVISGNLANLGDFGVGDEKCVPLNTTQVQERCLCDNAKSAKYGAFLCGRQWLKGSGYSPGGLCIPSPLGGKPNCQDFVTCLLKVCRIQVPIPTSGDLWGGEFG